MTGYAKQLMENNLMAQPPDWLESLVDAVSECMEPHNVMGPLGYRWHEEDQFCTIAVYALPVELVGGDVDGERVIRTPVRLFI